MGKPSLSGSIVSLGSWQFSLAGGNPQTIIFDLVWDESRVDEEMNQKNCDGYWVYFAYQYVITILINSVRVETLMKTTYQYHFYPNTQQKLELNDWLRVSRYWYNHQLGERFDWWEMNRTAVNSCPLLSSIVPPREKPNYYSQKQQLPGLKKDLVKVFHSGELLDFTRVDSTILQEVSKRVDRAFERFAIGDVNGKRAGKPRFKTGADFRTMTFATAKDDWIKLVRKNWMYIRLPKLGVVKVRMHRPIPSGFKVKQLSVTKKTDGWYLQICLEDATVPSCTSDPITPNWENSLGLDAVLHEDIYLATSEGELLPSFKPLRRNQSKLDRISQKRNKRKRGSRCRRKLAKREAKQHQRIARDRKDFQYLKRLGLDIFPSIKRRSGNLSIVGTIDNSTIKEILNTLNWASRSPRYTR